jgi:hypothetical protein
MRFYRSRVISPKKWGQHSGARGQRWLRKSKIHGKRFDETPWVERILTTLLV